MIFLDGLIIYLSIFSYYKWRGRPLSGKAQWAWAFVLTFGKLFVWLILSFSMLNFDDGYHDMLTNKEKENLVPLMNNYTLFFPVWSIYYSQLASYRRNYDESYLRKQNLLDYLNDNLAFCFRSDREIEGKRDRCYKLLKYIYDNRDYSNISKDSLYQLWQAQKDSFGQSKGTMIIDHILSRNGVTHISLPLSCGPIFYTELYYRLLFAEKYNQSYLKYLHSVYISNEKCQTVKYIFFSKVFEIINQNKRLDIDSYSNILSDVVNDHENIFEVKKLIKYSKDDKRNFFLEKIVCSFDTNNLYNEFCNAR
ncbi:hypothetical protein [Halobacteriovorax sp. ZH4_bin.1]|uniref:hypothetical protein n=2 Tax=Halobacteriovorax TaxID=1652133 RepID=UPI003722265C